MPFRPAFSGRRDDTSFDRCGGTSREGPGSLTGSGGVISTCVGASAPAPPLAASIKSQSVKLGSAARLVQ